MEEMELELTWKALFQRRVIMADAHCQALHGLLGGLLEVLNEMGWHETAAVAEETRRELEAASTALGLAIANMGAALHLALWGKSRRECAPLRSVDDIDDDPQVWLVLLRLREATEIAMLLHDRVETIRVHMDAADVLAAEVEGDGGGGDNGDGPWRHGLSISENINGHMELGEALDLVMILVSLTSAAREEVF
uniref:Uncharacterized protein n=1 Tax=Leersia perrieri TaxID=77586 RepID=A0A0D9UWZ3_9ORYZ